MKNPDQIQSFKFEIKIGSNLYKIDLSDDLKINRETIDTALSRQPGLFGWIAVLEAMATNQVDKRKVELDRCYSQLDIRFRKEARRKEGKITEAQLLAMISTDETYIKHQDRYLSAKRDAGLLKALVMALVHKRDSMVALVNLMRREQ